MKGLCSYCSRYFFCSKRPKQNEKDVILCSSFTQNNDNKETIWEQRRYEIAKELFPSMLNVGKKLNASFAAILAVNCADVLINRLKKSKGE